MYFAVRGKVLDEMYRSLEWSKRLREAETVEEVQKVIAEYCQSHGYKVKYIEEERKSIWQSIRRIFRLRSK